MAGPRGDADPAGASFPWCTNLSRTKDLDHITRYLPPEHGGPAGPAGQTNPANLAPLCRRHHRTKTHSGWSYTMPEPGIYLWRSPLGHRYLVDHTGTSNLTNPVPADPAPADPVPADPVPADPVLAGTG